MAWPHSARWGDSRPTAQRSSRSGASVRSGDESEGEGDRHEPDPGEGSDQGGDAGADLGSDRVVQQPGHGDAHGHDEQGQADQGGDDDQGLVDGDDGESADHQTGGDRRRGGQAAQVQPSSHQPGEADDPQHRRGDRPVEGR
jgi:hypothetical protein